MHTATDNTISQTFDTFGIEGHLLTLSNDKTSWCYLLIWWIHIDHFLRVPDFVQVWQNRSWSKFIQAGGNAALYP
jgi:hypothetical protein